MISALHYFIRTCVPPPVTRKAREWGVTWRFRIQRSRARRGYRKYGNLYPHSLLFVAGLPKSGTSWLESMLASYPGYQSVVIPDVVRYELRHGGSHDYDLPTNTLERLEAALAVSKLHVHGSEQNVQLLHDAGIPYVVLYRDLRDVAVSHYFYVRRTPWHPEYEDYLHLSVEEGLMRFGRTLLPDFVVWIRSWRERRDPELGLELQYEDLLDNTKQKFQAVTEHYGLNVSQARLERIVEGHRFENITDGRSRGEENESSFARKGVAGDWQTHFTERVKDLFKTHAGQALIDFGYESNLKW